MQSSSEPSSARRWVVLACAVVLFLFLGLVYAWSNFVAPLETEFGWNRSETSLAFTWCMSFFCIGGFVSGLLSRRFLPWVNLLVAAVFMAGGLLAASRLDSITQLYLFYGVFTGFGIGIAYNTVISTGLLWFGNNPGFASGVMLMGFGLGGLALGTACTGLIGSIGWRPTFAAIGISFGVLVVLASLIIKRPPQVAQASGGTTALSGHTTGQMLAEPSFWMLLIWNILVSGACLTMIGNASPLAIDLGITPQTAALFTGVISLFNGGSRVITGTLYDKFSYRKVILLVGGVGAVAFATTLLALHTGNSALLVVGFALTGLTYGGAPITSSTLAGSFYGKKNYSVNYSILNLNILVASFAGPFLAGKLQTASGSFNSTALVMLCFVLAALLLGLFIRQPKAK